MPPLGLPASRSCPRPAFRSLPAGLCALAFAVAASSEVAAQCELTTVRALDGAPGDGYGRAVALGDDTALIGAASDSDAGADSGSAYVHGFDPASSWTQTVKLTASDGGAGDRFGSAVALAGKLAAIGAPLAPDFFVGQGAVYVFEETLFGGWIESERIVAVDGFTGDEFGAAVTVSGATLAVGAPGDDDGGSGAGSVYVYEATSAGCVLVAKLTAFDGAAGDAFGTSVVLAGDLLAVGAPADADAGANTGAVYVFRRGLGGWTFEQKLVPDDAAQGDLFGHDVDLEGDTLVAGAHGEDDGGFNAGAVYVFTRVGTSWSQAQKLIADDPQDFDQFGFAVALAGERIVAGAHTEDENGNSAGAGYLLERATGVWAVTAKLLATGGAAGDQFGRDVAAHAGNLLIGNDFDHLAGNTSGAAHVFMLASELSLWGCPLTVGVTAGGSQKIHVQAHPALGSQFYWVLGSASGTAPGLPSGEFVLPLNFDNYMLFRFSNPNIPPLTNALWILNPDGTQTTNFGLPPGMPVSLVGLELHHAAVVMEVGSFDTLQVTTPTPVRITL